MKAFTSHTKFGIGQVTAIEGNATMVSVYYPEVEKTFKSALSMITLFATYEDANNGLEMKIEANGLAEMLADNARDEATRENTPFINAYNDLIDTKNRNYMSIR
jgi:hypothetical protein